MQLRTKWGALLLVALLLSSLGTAGLVLAKSDSSAPAAQTSAPSSLPGGLQKEPLNPAFVQYQQEKAAGKVATQTVDGHGLGWVPPTIKPSTATTAPSLMQAQTYPAAFDLRTQNKVSPVEDQGSCGSCWTFATFGSLESYLLPGSTTTYSENNLKNLADFGYACCQGGDAAMSTAYLARWGWSTAQLDAYNQRIYAGPVTSTSDPYSLSCTSPTTSQVAMHVQNVYYVPLKQSPLDNNAIKSALTTYGGVYTAFSWDGSASVPTAYWNPTPAAYYDHTSETGNHAVTIVGWDDNYAKTNFATTPPDNGAWIVKNSWGTSWGKAGYFYVSYDDANMGHLENAVFTAEPTTNYNTSYQYDALGWVESYGSADIGSSPSTTAWGANVFTATSNQQLSAVSFYAGSVNTQYQIFVYTDPTAGSPIGGTEYIGPAGTIAMSGYHTIPLTTTVPLTAGHQFSVVIEITTPGNNYPIPVESTEYQWTGTNWVLYSSATGQPGQGYLSATGTSWTDATQVNTNMSICIKAFAKTVGVAGAPAVTAQNANSVDLFVKGTDNALWYKHWDGTKWSNPTSLGGVLTSDPAATSSATGTISVFVRGNDNGIWSRTTTDGGATWSNWVSLGGQIPSGTGPAACSWGSGRLAVFARGTDGAMWYRTYTGTSWSNWQSLGGILTSSPAATSRNSGGMTVFVRGNDGGIWYRDYVGGSWGNWVSIGGQTPAGRAPAICSWGGGRLDVFAQGTDGALWQKSYTTTSGWSNWQSISGSATSSPAATSPGTGLIDVVARGTDNGLWEKTYSGGWSAWTSAGGL